MSSPASHRTPPAPSPSPKTASSSSSSSSSSVTSSSSPAAASVAVASSAAATSVPSPQTRARLAGGTAEPPAAAAVTSNQTIWLSPMTPMTPMTPVSPPLRVARHHNVVGGAGGGTSSVPATNAANACAAPVVGPSSYAGRRRSASGDDGTDPGTSACTTTNSPSMKRARFAPLDSCRSGGSETDMIACTTDSRVPPTETAASSAWCTMNNPSAASDMSAVSSVLVGETVVDATPSPPSLRSFLHPALTGSPRNVDDVHALAADTSSNAAGETSMREAAQLLRRRTASTEWLHALAAAFESEAFLTAVAHKRRRRRVSAVAPARRAEPTVPPAASAAVGDPPSSSSLRTPPLSVLSLTATPTVPGSAEHVVPPFVLSPVGSTATASAVPVTAAAVPDVVVPPKAVAAAAPAPALAWSAAVPSSWPAASSADSGSAALQPLQTDSVGPATRTAATAATQAPARPLDNTRCHVCRRRLPLVALQCRCGGYYCTKHLSANIGGAPAEAESVDPAQASGHLCTFDYRAAGKTVLQSTLTRVGGNRGLERI